MYSCFGICFIFHPLVTEFTLLGWRTKFSGQATATERARHELALAIGLWSTIARSTGRREAAASAFALAFDLVAEARDREAEANLRSRASYLLIDLGHPGFAFSFLDAAAEHYLITFNRERFGTCLVDRAIADIVQGEIQKAENALNKAIDLLPAEEWRYRVAAYHSLSICAERRHDLGRSNQMLQQAISEYGDRRDSSYGQFCWSRGRHAFLEGRLAEASKAFREAAEILSAMGEPFEGELALVDVAEVAVREEKRTELKKLGQEFLARVPKNSHSRTAKEALLHLANDLLFRSPAECRSALETCREKLKLAGELLFAPAFLHR